MSKLKFLLFFLPLLILISCSKDYTEEEVKQIVKDADKKLEKLAGQKYEWASAKAYSTVMAYYTTPDIIFINENLKYRTTAEAFNLYYFKDGNLIHFIGKKMAYIYEKNKKSRKELTRLTMYLEQDGDVISYEKIINTERVSLKDSDLEEVLNHAKELYELVGDH
ncbi:hypothetical protein BMS3Abin03_02274 [bacterium BMS3Abin03]|nr:hypothetical protein BMS3Abin03_02274 [bacterium BMS3Abin03]